MCFLPDEQQHTAEDSYATGMQCAPICWRPASAMLSAEFLHPCSIIHANRGFSRALWVVLVFVLALGINVLYMWIALSAKQERRTIHHYNHRRNFPALPYAHRRVIFNSMLVRAQQLVRTSSNQFADYDNLNVCLLTADIPFTATHGGTATAYYLLAQLLAAIPQFNVTVVGLQFRQRSSFHDCDGSETQHALASVGVRYECLQSTDFVDGDGREVVSISMWDRLALGLVRWMDRSRSTCDVIHGHEWGGVTAFLALIMQLDPTRYPGVHLLIEPHGGHMWSRIGSERRPSDMLALHTDDMERIAVEFADAVLSPSRYMLGYFATRGWRVVHRYVLPNVIEHHPTRDHLSRKPVWRLCFVGRLEERKGIKLFLHLLQMLSAAQRKSDIQRPALNAMIFGTLSSIDGQRSDKWLEAQMANYNWSFPIIVHLGLNRSRVWSAMQQEGILLILPSVQENLSYVLAEAATLQIPTVTFDVGGSREILQLAAGDDLTFCTIVAVDCLHSHVQAILSAGTHYAPQLSETMMKAGDKWIEWHGIYGRVRQQLATYQNAVMQVPPVGGDRARTNSEIEIIKLATTNQSTTRSLLQSACSREMLAPGAVEVGTDPGELVLLLPTQFEILPSRLENVNQTFRQLFSASADAAELFRVGAIAFGVQLDDSSSTYPSAPTWILYSRDGWHCEELFPVVVRRQVLCQSFAVDPRIFPVYRPWILADVIGQQNLRMITYPDVMFQYRRGSSITELPSSPTCRYGAAPANRYTNGMMLDHFHRDVAQDMRDVLSTRASCEPGRVDLTTALSKMRNQSFGVLASVDSGTSSHWKTGVMVDEDLIVWYTWISERQRFGCENSTYPYPYATADGVFHPCVSAQRMCCGRFHKAVSLARYTFSNIQMRSSKRVLLSVTSETETYCGDGVVIRGEFAIDVHNIPKKLFQDRIGVQRRGEDISMRRTHTIELEEIREGSWFDVIIDPLDSQLCDGVALNIVFSQ